MVQYTKLEAKITKILADTPLDINAVQPIFAEISQILDGLIGHKLLTFTVLHPSHEYVIRLYSNMAGDYALEDTKPMVKDDWSELVIEQGQTFYVSTAKEMIPIFPDHQKIFDMGLGSAMTIPIIKNGKTLGTANLLDEDGVYTNIDFAPLIKACQLAAPIFAAYQKYNCKAN